ncbi:MAG: hypothetical protein JST31_06265 [Actinobacteria bacterium]|nr:hypothetical protein [Actinomycetota bacterium]
MSAEAIFAAIAAELLPEPGVEEGTGFGTNPGLRSGGRIFAMVVRGELVYKLPAARCEELAGGGRAHLFVVGKREMREWVAFEVLDGDDDFLGLAREARAFVSGA